MADSSEPEFMKLKVRHILPCLNNEEFFYLLRKAHNDKYAPNSNLNDILAVQTLKLFDLLRADGDVDNAVRTIIVRLNLAFFTQAVKQTTTSSTAEKSCSACGNKKEKLLRCSQCKNAYYCDQACQLKAWDKHKEHCVKKS